MTTYVVGDIQGCFEPFMALLTKLKFNPDTDRLWSVGDLVNRGPGNIETLRWFYAHRDNVTMVLGNHDLHLLAVSCGARKASRKDNLDDILEAPPTTTEGVTKRLVNIFLPAIKYLHKRCVENRDGDDGDRVSAMKFFQIACGPACTAP